jgi:small subunit ribosomal protein S19
MERSTPIVSEFVGRRIYVNNGIRLVPVSVLEEMVGHHVGEFAATRKRPIRPVAKQAKLVSKSSKK